MLSEQYKAEIALSGRTANHDSHCSNCRSVMLLPHHKTLQHNCAQQSESAQSDKHRDIETSCACSITVHLKHSDFCCKVPCIIHDWEAETAHITSKTGRSALDSTTEREVSHP